MAGTIVADTLTHSTAGSIATNYVVDGSAKAWFSMNEATPVFNDSFNFASITDNATGDKTVSFTSSMGNANYSVSQSNANSGTDYTRGTGGAYDQTVSASSYRYYSCGGSSASSNGYLRDDTRMKQMYIGDLA